MELFVVALFVVAANAQNKILERDTYYKRMKLAPNNSSLIKVVLNVPHIQACLQKCDETPECISVIFNNTNCELHNDTVGIIEYQFSATLEAVALITRAEKRGK